MGIKSYSYPLVCCTLLGLGGCVTEHKESEGISMSGGNAIAYNTALQVIDPWPANVQDTDLVVPAETATRIQPAVSESESTATNAAVPVVLEVND